MIMNRYFQNFFWCHSCGGRNLGVKQTNKIPASAGMTPWELVESCRNLGDKKIDRGFTLVETLVVVSIFVILVFVLTNFQRDLWSQNSFMQNSLVAESEARGALKNFIAELRAGAPGNDGTYPIVSASSTAITFFTDIDHDGVRERVRYFMQNGNLMKGTIEPTGTPYSYRDTDERLQTAVHNVTNTNSGVFSYYSEDYDGATSSLPLPSPISIAEVRLVKITIAIDSDPNRAPAVMTFQSQVAVRNLKDNL